ncbi:MAG: thioredoxin domain-containing protein [Limisphaerales bacterium]
MPRLKSNLNHLVCTALVASLFGCSPQAESPESPAPTTQTASLQNATKPVSHQTSNNAAVPAENEQADSQVEKPKEDKKEHKFTNRLKDEKSPYLRQHMHNPVDWYPWGEAAFAKAKAENKPILLSIGYSTCHWCHVMERESFENETIAKYLNEHFISIKVDREERPDVDKIYMTFVQTFIGGGGWPLNVFLTPDRKPFFGGTYFPAEPKYGKRTFLDLLQLISSKWKDPESHKQILDGAGEQMKVLLQQVATAPVDGLEPTKTWLTNALTRFKGQYEPRHGGFGQKPKFPRPSVPRFVLSQGVKQQDKQAIDMVLFTCEKMAAGGIYDHIGGGFARYSVDEKWLVPHFEKMLYDNAQLVHLYLDAYLVSGEQKHAEVVRDILKYILRDMTHSGGGFYSAEDADSEGQEGKFYCWTEEQLKELLSEDEFKLVVRYYGITEEGNFEDHSHPDPLKHLNVLSIVDPKLSADEAKLLASANQKLFDKRVTRVRPGLDDKVLASWNGLMLGAIARAGAVLQEPKYLAAAEKNVKFIQDKLWVADQKTLYHRWREGERDDVQLLDAYAAMADGSLHLYEATLNPKHLQFSLDLADAMIAKFYDPKQGGFYQSDGTDTNLVMRLKEDYDGAEPSGNSVATLALLKLSKITDRKDLHEAAEKTLRLFAKNLQANPQIAPYLVSALEYLLQEPHRLVLAGDAKSDLGKQLLSAAHGVYQPNKVILSNTGPVEEFAKGLEPGDKPVAAYVCTGTFCHQPTAEPARVSALLKGEKKE